MRLCPHCKQSKTLDEFGLRHTGGAARQSWCRSCIDTARRVPNLEINDNPGAISVEECMRGVLESLLPSPRRAAHP